MKIFATSRFGQTKPVLLFCCFLWIWEIAYPPLRSKVVIVLIVLMNSELIAGLFKSAMFVQEKQVSLGHATPSAYPDAIKTSPN